MAHRARAANRRNSLRQKRYLDKGIVMLPTLAEENKARGKKIRTSRRIKGPSRAAAKN